MSAYRSIFTAIIGMFFIILIGIIGFQFFEKISFFDALWMTVITVLTVGYGDVIPETIHGKIFALTIIPIGISLVAYALGAVVAIIIEGEFSKTVGRKRMERKIKNLQNHIILCGLGRVGKQVAMQLQREKVPLVVIEQQRNNFEMFSKDTLGNMLYIEGDATEDALLKQAGISRAAGIIAALPQDADNVLIALTAKGINSNIQVVARAEKTESEEKLRRAGADKVINPSSIGGRRMALSILKPTSIDYVDTILHSQKEELDIEEMMMKGSSTIVNKSLRQSNIREKYGVTIVAIRRNKQIISNPRADEVLQVNDLVIVVGKKEQLNQFEQDSKG